MQLVYCKFPSNIECLLYTLSDNQIVLPEDMNVTIIQDVKLKDYPHLQVLNFEQFQAISIKSNCRLPDKQLAEEGISSFDDLKNAYFLLRNKQLKKSSLIRNLVEQKYRDLSCFF